MVRPQTRRNVKAIVLSSEDDEEEDAPVPASKSKAVRTTRERNDDSTSLSTRNKSLKEPALAKPTTGSSTLSPEASPKKPVRNTTKDKTTEKLTAKPTYSFFNAATQENQQRQSIKKKKEEIVLEKDNEIDDSIQDVPSEEEKVPRKQAGPGAASFINPTKRSRSEFDLSMSHASAPQASQKFLKTTDGSRVRATSSIPQQEIVDPRPWIEKYGPRNLDDLVVHKKKVADVRQWLDEALKGQKYRRLLVLKGPAGSGRTATTSLLSAAMEFEIVEWRNPGGAAFSSNDYVSASAQFEDFLGRSGKFGSLEFGRLDQIPTTASSVINVDNQAKHGAQVVLVEEFPTIITRATPALQAFRNTILQSLAVTNGMGPLTNPIVMIITESTTSSGSNPSEDFTAQRLLGPEILNHPATTMIEFNLVAPTFITRAVNLVLDKHALVTGARYNPSDAIIQKLSETGDVRNAISTLEFLCLQMRSTVSAPTTLSKKKTTSRTSKNKVSTNSPSASDTAALSMLSLRESTIGLFHAVGKVLYNKRTTSAAPPDVEILPHQSHLIRSIAPEVVPEMLIDETGTDTSTFLAALHENYVLSCFDPGGDLAKTLDSVNSSLDALCDADLLGTSSIFSFNGQGRNDNIRQDEFAFAVGVRGILLALPHPVKRQVPPVGLRPGLSSRSGAVVPSGAGGSGRSDQAANRMFYPTSLKLWRARDETQGLLDHFVTMALDGRLDKQVVQSQLSRVQTPSSATSPSERFTSISSLQNESKPNDANDLAAGSVAIGSGNSARHELLLERLPYLAQILRPGPGLSSSVSGSPLWTLQRQVERVTRFTGIRDAEDDEVGQEVQIDGGRGREIFGKVMAGNGVGELNEGIKGLVLSDDDIVDD